MCGVFRLVCGRDDQPASDHNDVQHLGECVDEAEAGFGNADHVVAVADEMGAPGQAVHQGTVRHFHTLGCTRGTRGVDHVHQVTGQQRPVTFRLPDRFAGHRSDRVEGQLIPEVHESPVAEQIVLDTREVGAQGAGSHRAQDGGGCALGQDVVPASLGMLGIHRDVDRTRADDGRNADG